MNPDMKTVEQLVEIIAREVLVTMAEQQQRAAAPAGGQCKLNCAEGLCVCTCFDRTGMVVDAGAERLSSSIGMIPQDTNLARMIDHTLLKPDATPDQIAQLCFEARKCEKDHQTPHQQGDREGGHQQDSVAGRIIAPGNPGGQLRPRAIPEREYRHGKSPYENKPKPPHRKPLHLPEQYLIY